jgi:hypothetical protein
MNKQVETVATRYASDAGTDETKQQERYVYNEYRVS